MNSTALLNSTALEIPYSNIFLTLFLALISSGSIAGLLIQHKTAKLRSIEEKLREDRRKVYFDLLDPFIFLFSNISSSDKESNIQSKVKEAKKQEEVLKKFMSEEYRRTALELILLGSDEVVKAYNNIMQYAYLQKEDNSKIILLYATLLLEIRRDLEYKKTRLNEKDMLSNMIRDIDKLNFSEIMNKD